MAVWGRKYVREKVIASYKNDNHVIRFRGPIDSISKGLWLLQDLKNTYYKVEKPHY